MAAGEIGMKTEHLIYYTASGERRAITTPTVGDPGGIATGSIGKSDTALVYKPEDGNLRTVQGTSVPTSITGDLAVDGEYLAYIPTDGNQRVIQGDVDGPTTPAFSLTNADSGNGARIYVSLTNYSQLVRLYLGSWIDIAIRPSSSMSPSDWEYKQQKPVQGADYVLETYGGNGLVDGTEYEIALAHFVESSDPQTHIVTFPSGNPPEYSAAGSYSATQTITAETPVTAPLATPPSNVQLSVEALAGGSCVGEMQGSWEHEQVKQLRYTLFDPNTGSTYATGIKPETGAFGGAEAFSDLCPGSYRLRVRYENSQGTSDWAYSMTQTLF